MLPCLAGIDRFVNAIADGEIGTAQALAAGNIDDVRVGGRDCDGADRLRLLAVEYRSPGAAVVVALPYAAVDLANIEDVGLARNSGGCASAAAAEGANHAPAQ